MIPQRRPDQDFDDHQAEMAAWLGTDVATMNLGHDPLHRTLCACLGVPSYAMLDAAGVMLDERQRGLAVMEEAAVLHCQRLVAAHIAEMPQ